MDWKELIGKKIVALRGYVHKGYRDRTGIYHSAKETKLEFILFDDGETYLELEEQNAYDYHDCSPSARHLELQKDKIRWEALMEMKAGLYAEPKQTKWPF